MKKGLIAVAPFLVLVSACSLTLFNEKGSVVKICNDLKKPLMWLSPTLK